MRKRKAYWILKGGLISLGVGVICCENNDNYRVSSRLSVLMALYCSGTPEDERATALTLLNTFCSWSFWLSIFLVTDFFCPWDFWEKKWISELTRGLAQPFMCKRRSYHAMQKQNFIHHWYDNIMESHNYTKWCGQCKLWQLILSSLLKRIGSSQVRFWAGV